MPKNSARKEIEKTLKLRSLFPKFLYEPTTHTELFRSDFRASEKKKNM